MPTYVSIIQADPTLDGYNSFVSLEDADAYFQGTYFVEGETTWDEQTPEDKDRLLITASRALGSLTWTGTATGPLAFPRSYSYHEYGYDRTEDIPTWLTALTCEYAKWLWQERPGIVAEGALRGVKSAQLDTISVTFQDGVGQTVSSLPSSVQAILAPLSPTYINLGGRARSMTMHL